MKLHIFDDPISTGAAAARLIADVARNSDQPVLGLATGSSPIPIYHDLISQVRRGDLDLTSTRAFTLDEYVGLSVSDIRRYRYVIRDAFTVASRIPDKSINTPDVDAPDLDAEALRYEAAVIEAGVDVQILGLGSNGHIAFNEPGSRGDSVTRVVELEDQTRRDNARFFRDPDEVPRRAITQGIATIMRSRRIVLIATGAAKSRALRALVDGEIDEAWPATALINHPYLSVFADQEAVGATHSRS